MKTPGFGSGLHKNLLGYGGQPNSSGGRELGAIWAIFLDYIKQKLLCLSSIMYIYSFAHRIYPKPVHSKKNGAPRVAYVLAPFVWLGYPTVPMHVF